MQQESHTWMRALFTECANPTRPCARSEDEFDATFVYGPEASNAEIHGRSVSPLIRKFAEGYNVCVLLFGATGASHQQSERRISSASVCTHTHRTR